MKIVNRNEIEDATYREILDVETHHNHEIYEDNNGTLRWKENPLVIKYLEKISLNDLAPFLSILGYGKNSEVYRKLYRDMGYSLFGYWEIFYWEVNNNNADKYFPATDNILLRWWDFMREDCTANRNEYTEEEQIELINQFKSIN